jgi:hypothetical protein
MVHSADDDSDGEQDIDDVLDVFKHELSSSFSWKPNA